MKCRICDRFLFVHADEEARWCYQLFLDRERAYPEPEPQPRAIQDAWLDVPLSRDSIHP